MEVWCGGLLGGQWSEEPGAHVRVCIKYTVSVVSVRRRGDRSLLPLAAAARQLTLGVRNARRAQPRCARTGEEASNSWRPAPVI
jgi:hypothetical protein